MNKPYVHAALGALLLTAASPRHATAAAQVPGPSQALWNAPYYACENNYYVATTGSDSNNGTSLATPWATLQHANNALPTGGAAAGSCVNVASGTYTKGVLINRGGKLAKSTGYVVYRCQVLDKCIVTDVNAGGQNGSFVWDFSTQPMQANFVFIDGFTMTASSATLYGQGIELWDGNESGKAQNSVHHVWIVNSIISGYGQSGVQMNDGEYFYVIHNTIYDNSRAGCSAQGSGISFAVLKAFPNYVRTMDDANNKLVGNIGKTAHNAVEWNVLYNNAITECGSQANPYDTDGNDIILDTLNNQGSTNVNYLSGVLVAFNIVYNAGGRGIHAFLSDDNTIANNSCYNSSIDPFDNGTYRPCIGDLFAYGNTFMNNIGVGVPVNAPNSAQCGDNQGKQASCDVYNNAFTGGLQTGDTPDTFINNISNCDGTNLGYGCNAMFNGDVFSCTANHCNTNPSWVAVGNQSTGTETTQPQSANFALASGSPAIGIGLLKTYLSAQSVDVGACSSAVSVCPLASAQPHSKFPRGQYYTRLAPRPATSH